MLVRKCILIVPKEGQSVSELTFTEILQIFYHKISRPINWIHSSLVSHPESKSTFGVVVSDSDLPKSKFHPEISEG